MSVFPRGLGRQLSVTQLKQEFLRGALQSKNLNDPIIEIMKMNHTLCCLPTPSCGSSSQHQAARNSCVDDVNKAC